MVGFRSVAWSQGLVSRTVHAENGNYNLLGKVPLTGPFSYFNQCKDVLRLDDVTDVYTQI